MRYLLDTNALSDLVRHPDGQIADGIRQVGQENVVTSLVVSAEIWFGLSRTPSARLSAQVDAVLGAIEILPLESPADRIYGQLRADLQRKGRPIGANDLFIAAHALALDCTLVTDNMREFARVPDLRVENWLR
jgi:tRNA(fMet)-specific endonuclease VapC